MQRLTREPSLSDLFPPFNAEPPKATRADETLSLPSFAQNSLCEAHVTVLHKTEAWSAADSGDGKPPVTYFLIEVRIGASAYVVRRRYKDFDKLHADLCSAYGKHAVPAIPPKQLLKNEDAEFVRRRQVQLATYLDGVVSDKVLSMSAEVCAFLECEAGSQLACTAAALSANTAMLLPELAAAERLCGARLEKIEAGEREIAVLQGALSAACTERDAFFAERNAARRERDAAAAAATAARNRVLAMLCRARDARCVASAMEIWAAQRKERPVPNVANAFSAALSAALSGLQSPGGVPVADVSAASEPAAPESAAVEPKPPTEEPPPPPHQQEQRQQQQQQQSPLPASSTPPPPPPPRAASLVVAPPTERAIKAGLLLKQGAGNKAFQERYFELVTLGEGAQYGAFLVYYESELKASVKGYISLDGARIAPAEHSIEPYCLTLTTPAKRLSVVAPAEANSKGQQGQGTASAHGGLGGGGDAAAAAKRPSLQYDCPPSLDAKMNLLQKLDNWGKQALRNAMAGGPVTTWTLAATSRAELDAWLRGFTDVLGAGAVAGPIASDAGHVPAPTQPAAVGVM